MSPVRRRVGGSKLTIWGDMRGVGVKENTILSIQVFFNLLQCFETEVMNIPRLCSNSLFIWSLKIFQISQLNENT